MSIRFINSYKYKTGVRKCQDKNLKKSIKTAIIIKNNKNK